MQHVSVADKSLLVGDLAANLLLEYASLLAQIGSSDTVKLRAVSGDGDEVVVTFLLNSGTVMVAESTHSSLPEPENSEAEAYLRKRLDSYVVTEIDLIGLTGDGEA